jgi:hypothetical protein
MLKNLRTTVRTLDDSCLHRPSSKLYYFGISIALTNRNLTYRHLKRGNQRLKATSLTNRSRSCKYLIDWLFTIFMSRSRIFHFRPTQEYFTYTILRPAQEIFTYTIAFSLVAGQLILHDSNYLSTWHTVKLQHALKRHRWSLCFANKAELIVLDEFTMSHRHVLEGHQRQPVRSWRCYFASVLWLPSDIADHS